MVERLKNMEHQISEFAKKWRICATGCSKYGESSSTYEAWKYVHEKNLVIKLIK